MIRKCLLCGKEFKINSSQQKFCCVEHKKEFKKKSKVPKERQYILICSKCGKEFISKANNRKECDYCRGRKNCEYCGKEFQSENRRRKTCSVECDKLLRKKKTKQTSLERYGVESPNQTVEKINETKRTFKRKYGGHPSKTKEFIENRKKTCLDKYNVENTLQVKGIREKITKTRRKKYGQHMEKIIEKSRKTCLERYGYEYGIFSENNIIRSISKENVRVGEMLEQNGYEIRYEKPIGNYSYDIEILNKNILIEIDPTYTHNSTNGYYIKAKYKEPKDKYYHYNKTKLALESGYVCIHKFDWVTDVDLLKMIKKIDNSKNLFNQDEPKLHWYNKTTNKYLLDNDFDSKDMLHKGYVGIFDDGLQYKLI